jgi:maleate cis-trans isomerase
MSRALRIGALFVDGNVVLEREMNRLAPDVVDFKFSTFRYPPADAPFCEGLLVALEAPLSAMRTWGAEAVFLGCTTASMCCADPAHDDALSKIAGAPVVTAAQATKRAADALGVKRLGVASPYGEANNRIVRTFLETQDLNVVSLHGLALDEDLEVWRAIAIPMTPEGVLNLCMKADCDDAEAVYLPCTGVGSVDAIPLFEAKVGKPAFSSVQAGFWASLSDAGLRAHRSGAGRLLAEWPS